VSALVLTGVPLLRPPGTARVRPALAFRVGRTLHARRLIGEARMEALRRRYGSADYRAETGVMRAVHVRAVNETYEDQLRAVRCPVELVWGANDTTVPATVAGAAAALLAHARVTVLPGVGHLTPLAAPEALAEAVGRHLS
jgi:pimeloyl-ACP methyl ester carboxylesterase